MSDQPDPSHDDGPGFAEPSDEVKQRNRITGLIILGLVLGMIAIGMIVRVYGS